MPRRAFEACSSCGCAKADCKKLLKSNTGRFRKLVADAQPVAARKGQSIKSPLPLAESPLPPPLPPPLSPPMTPSRCLLPQMQPTVTPPKCLPPQDALPLAMPLHAPGSASVSSVPLVLAADVSVMAAEQKPSYPALGDLVQVNCDAAPHRSTKAKPKTPSPKVVKEKKPKKKLSGAQRRQAAKKITADIQALRREMEQHNAILQQSREAAQQEKEAVQNELQEKGSEANEKRGDLTVERSCLQRASNQLSLRCLQLLERCQENLQQQQAALENAQQHGKNSIIRLKKVVAVAKAAAAKAVAEAKSIKPPLPPTESPLPPPLPPPVSPTMTPPRCLPPQMQPTVTPPQGLPLQDALPLAMPLHSASVSSELS